MNMGDAWVFLTLTILSSLILMPLLLNASTTTTTTLDTTTSTTSTTSTSSTATTTSSSVSTTLNTASSSTTSSSTTSSSASSSSLTSSSLTSSTSSSSSSTSSSLTLNTTSSTSTLSVPTTLNATSRSTSVSTSISSTTTTQPLNGTLLHSSGAAQVGGFKIKGGNGRIFASGSVIRNLNINFSLSDLQVNISVANQSQVPTYLPRPNRAYYQYIQINGTLGVPPVADVDQIVRSVVYSFSVPISWLQQKGLSNSSVRLLKYNPASQSWLELPTFLSSGDATSDFYTATSNSLSGYVVSFTSNGVTATTASISNTLGTNFMSYFFGVGTHTAAHTTSKSFTWTNDSNITKGKSSPDRFTNLSAIGHQVSNIGTATMASGLTSYSQSLVSYGANVANTITSKYVNVIVSNAIGATTSLSYFEGEVNSLVILMFTVAGDAGATISSPQTGCVTLRSVTQGSTNTGSAAALQTCNALATGTYTASITKSVTATQGTYAIASYVYPPGNIFFADNPATGNILTNGINQVNGNILTFLGTNTVAPVAPSGYDFVRFTVDSANSANIILNPLSGTTNTITALGSAIVTANYVLHGCIPQLSNTLITFPTTQAGLFASTSNAETVSNLGDSSANILVNGGNWISSSPSAAFLVSNTLWDDSSRTANNGNQLANSITGADTFMFLPGANDISTPSNTVYFGVNVPAAQPTATYAETINVMLSC